MVEGFLSDIGISQILIAFVIVYIASTAQSVFGMGWGMIAAPLLALLNPSLIPSTIVFLGFFASLLRSIRYYKDNFLTLAKCEIPEKAFEQIKSLLK